VAGLSAGTGEERKMKFRSEEEDFFSGLSVGLSVETVYLRLTEEELYLYP
jgi:hypothetical protein